MDWRFVVGLVIPTLAMIGLLIYLGVRWSCFVQQQAPDSHLALRVTMTGTIVSALFVAFWVLCLAARELAPESSLGRFVQNPEGLLIVFAFSFFSLPLLAVLLQSLGYPVARWGDSDD